mgnify:CR=1 FL=1
MNAPLPEAIRKSLESVTLDDKYDLTKSRVFVTGYQALVRMTMMQHERDKRRDEFRERPGDHPAGGDRPVGLTCNPFNRMKHAKTNPAVPKIGFSGAIHGNLDAAVGSIMAERRGRGSQDADMLDLLISATDDTGAHLSNLVLGRFASNSGTYNGGYIELEVTL